MRYLAMILAVGALVLAGCGGSGGGSTTGGGDNGGGDNGGTDGGNTGVVTPGPEAPAGLILFESDRDGDREIFAMNADGSGVTQLTNNAVVDTQPTLNPDNTIVIFVSNRDGQLDLYGMHVDGTDVVRLTNLGQCANPTFSPDGTKVLFAQAGDLRTIELDGTDLTNITVNAGTEEDREPRYSADGTKIVFVRKLTELQQQIYTANADGSAQTQITLGLGFRATPFFSLDGTRIFFATDAAIQVMDADGSDRTDVLNGDVRGVTQNADGSKLIYSLGPAPFQIVASNPDGSGATALTSGTSNNFFAAPTN